MKDHRPCERKCAAPPVGCGLWKHHSRFHSKKIPNGTEGKIYFDSVCRDCQQKKRNERKNADRPLAIIRGRAQEAAYKAGVPLEFVWTQMNWSHLVQEMRAMMGPEGTCCRCGHAFLNERDIQIDHLHPMRFRQDLARLHRSNLRLLCASCNNTKGTKPLDVWLDEQEGARLSNLLYPEEEPEVLDDEQQLQLNFT